MAKQDKPRKTSLEQGQETFQKLVNKIAELKAQDAAALQEIVAGHSKRAASPGDQWVYRFAKSDQAKQLGILSSFDWIIATNIVTQRQSGQENDAWLLEMAINNLTPEKRDAVLTFQLAEKQQSAAPVQTPFWKDEKNHIDTGHALNEVILDNQRALSAFAGSSIPFENVQSLTDILNTKLTAPLTADEMKSLFFVWNKFAHPHGLKTDEITGHLKAMAARAKTGQDQQPDFDALVAGTTEAKRAHQHAVNAAMDRAENQVRDHLQKAGYYDVSDHPEIIDQLVKNEKSLRDLAGIPADDEDDHAAILDALNRKLFDLDQPALNTEQIAALGFLLGHPHPPEDVEALSRDLNAVSAALGSDMSFDDSVRDTKALLNAARPLDVVHDAELADNEPPIVPASPAAAAASPARIIPLTEKAPPPPASGAAPSPLPIGPLTGIPTAQNDRNFYKKFDRAREDVMPRQRKSFSISRRSAAIWGGVALVALATFGAFKFFGGNKENKADKEQKALWQQYSEPNTTYKLVTQDQLDSMANDGALGVGHGSKASRYVSAEDSLLLHQRSLLPRSDVKQVRETHYGDSHHVGGDRDKKKTGKKQAAAKAHNRNNNDWQYQDLHQLSRQSRVRTDDFTPAPAYTTPTPDDGTDQPQYEYYVVPKRALDEPGTQEWLGELRQGLTDDSLRAATAPNKKMREAKTKEYRANQRHYYQVCALLYTAERQDTIAVEMPREEPIQNSFMENGQLWRESTTAPGAFDKNVPGIRFVEKVKPKPPQTPPLPPGARKIDFQP